MGTSDDSRGEYVDVTGRLRRLIDQLNRDIALGADDLSFAKRVAKDVGLEVDLSGSASLADAQSVLTRLREAWSRGSRRTGAALLRAYEAEDANDLAAASEILIATRDELAMPFYSKILDAELERIESK